MSPRFLVACCTLCGLLATVGALAGPPCGDDCNIQFHGFLTQGIVKTSANRFFGPSDRGSGSLEFTEIGLNGSISPRSDLLLTAQVLARKAGKMDDGSPALDFALLRWDFVDDGEYRAGFSLGRIKNPVGLYNVTRDVAHTRPGVFLPQVIYFDKVRNLAHSSDGLMLHLNHYGEYGQLFLDAGIGHQRSDRNLETVLLTRDWAGSLAPRGASRIAQVRFSTPEEHWRAALSYADGELDFTPGAGDPLGAGRSRFRFIVGSAQFADEHWTFTAEYAYQPVEQYGYAPWLDDDKIAEAYYIQLQHHFNPRFSLLLRYGEAYADRSNHDGTKLAARFPGAARPFQFFSRTLTFGARWHLTPRFLLSTEYALNDGTFSLSPLENPDPSRLQRRWHMFSLLGSYRF